MGALRMIIKFYTEGCQPCKAVSTVLNHEEVDYEEIDIGKDIDAAIHYKVRSVPTVINTETGATLVGFKGIRETTEWINEHCN
jgi:thioredoxin-like negative regulator of GroEL